MLDWPLKPPTSSLSHPLLARVLDARRTGVPRTVAEHAVRAAVVRVAPNQGAWSPRQLRKCRAGPPYMALLASAAGAAARGLGSRGRGVQPVGLGCEQRGRNRPRAALSVCTPMRAAGCCRHVLLAAARRGPPAPATGRARPTRCHLRAAYLRGPKPAGAARQARRSWCNCTAGACCRCALPHPPARPARRRRCSSPSGAQRCVTRRGACG